MSGSAPRNVKIAWSGSPARTNRAAPEPSELISEYCIGSRCCASSTSRYRTRRRSAHSRSSSVTNAAYADDTSSAASSAGANAVAESIPDSRFTSSYCLPNRPAATHSSRPCSSPSSIRSSGPEPAFGRAQQQVSQLVREAGQLQRGPQPLGPVRRPQLDVTGQQVAHHRVLLRPGQQPGRRLTEQHRLVPQHRERVGVDGPHQRLANGRDSRPVSSRVICARNATDARRFAVSTSTFSGSAPCSSTTCAASSASNVVLPVPGPPSTRTNPPGWSNTRWAASSHRGRGRVSGFLRTSWGGSATTPIPPRCTDKIGDARRSRRHPFFDYLLDR